MDNKPGTIVVGIDGSPSADRALQWAVEQAVAEHRALTLVHTIDPQNQAFNDEASIYSREVRAAVDAEGREVLRRAHAVVTRTAPTLEVHEVFDRTDPRDVLLELSEGAAMVVVGSRGRGPVRRLLLGSVSVAVVRHAKCPVVVLRPGNRGTVRNGIAVGIDASPESRPVLEFAYREASLQQLPLTVIHCVRSFPRGTAAILVPEGEGEGDLTEERLALAEAMAGLAEKYPDVRVVTQLSREAPQETLVQLAERMNLVVVGAHRDSRVSRAIFGSVSTAVVEHATCPVAVVPVSAAR